MAIGNRPRLLKLQEQHPEEAPQLLLLFGQTVVLMAQLIH